MARIITQAHCCRRVQQKWFEAPPCGVLEVALVSHPSLVVFSCPDRFDVHFAIVPGYSRTYLHISQCCLYEIITRLCKRLQFVEKWSVPCGLSQVKIGLVESTYLIHERAAVVMQGDDDTPAPFPFLYLHKMTATGTSHPHRPHDNGTPLPALTQPLIPHSMPKISPYTYLCAFDVLGSQFYYYVQRILKKTAVGDRAKKTWRGGLRYAGHLGQSHSDRDITGAAGKAEKARNARNARTVSHFFQ
jgi:hypothetical protein